MANYYVRVGFKRPYEEGYYTSANISGPFSEEYQVLAELERHNKEKKDRNAEFTVVNLEWAIVLDRIVGKSETGENLYAVGECIDWYETEDKAKYYASHTALEQPGDVIKVVHLPDFRKWPPKAE